MKKTLSHLAMALAIAMVPMVEATAVTVGRASSVSVARSAPAPSISRSTTVIGGKTGSVGVSKSAVVEAARNPVPTVPSRPIQSTQATPSYSTSYTPAPQVSGGYPAPAAPSTVTNGSTFASSLGGSLIGSMLGNAISKPSTPVVVNNNGGTTGGHATASSATTSVDHVGNTVYQQPTQSSGIGFWTVLLLILVTGGIGYGIWYLYTQHQKEKVSMKRSTNSYETQMYPVEDEYPLQPLQRFKDIQKAFSESDTYTLGKYVGSALFGEVLSTSDPENKSDIYGVSYNVILHNSREFSVKYVFNDGADHCQQLWHYELEGGQWKLQGIENL